MVSPCKATNGWPTHAGDGSKGQGKPTSTLWCSIAWSKTEKGVMLWLIGARQKGVTLWLIRRHKGSVQNKTETGRRRSRQHRPRSRAGELTKGGGGKGRSSMVTQAASIWPWRQDYCRRQDGVRHPPPLRRSNQVPRATRCGTRHKTQHTSCAPPQRGGPGFPRPTWHGPLRARWSASPPD